MGDYIRWSPPYYEGAHDSAKSALFLALNRNKRSIRLDLKNERGREALLRLVRDYDVVLESFRPGVLERLGVGYDRMREANPGIVYCAISGYGQDGPKRDASGHDMNYLGLIGLLGLTGERGGAPVQAAGQIADLGGGALMAAFGILAALRERDGASAKPPVAGRAVGCAGQQGSGEGQMVDVSMADGALSWLAMVAATYFADGQVPRRGDLPLGGRAGLLPPVRVRRRLGLARRARAEVLAGVVPRGRARGPDREAVRASRLRGTRGGGRDLQGPHARAVGGVRARARLLPGAGARARRGARLRARAGARDGRRARPAGRGAAGAPARRAREARPHARRARPPPGPGARRAHRAGAGARPATPRRRSPSCWPAVPRPGPPRPSTARR